MHNKNEEISELGPVNNNKRFWSRSLGEWLQYRTHKGHIHVTHTAWLGDCQERKKRRERKTWHDQWFKYTQVQTMINVDNDREENDMTSRCRKVKGKRLKVRAAKLTWLITIWKWNKEELDYSEWFTLDCSQYETLFNKEKYNSIYKYILSI